MRLMYVIEQFSWINGALNNSWFITVKKGVVTQGYLCKDGQVRSTAHPFGLSFNATERDIAERDQRILESPDGGYFETRYDAEALCIKLGVRYRVKT